MWNFQNFASEKDRRLSLPSGGDELPDQLLPFQTGPDNLAVDIISLSGQAGGQQVLAPFVGACDGGLVASLWGLKSQAGPLEGEAEPGGSEVVLEAPMDLMPLTSTFLVDDSPSFLQSAARFLASEERIEIVGVALSAVEGLAEVERLQPRLVLMDLAMPGINGLEGTRRLKSLSNPPFVVILTLHDTDEYRLAALQAGADGFMAKSDFGQKLLPLLETILASPSRSSAPAAPAVPEASAAAAARATEDRGPAAGPASREQDGPVPLAESAGRMAAAEPEERAPQTFSPEAMAFGASASQRLVVGKAEGPAPRRMRVLLAEDGTAISHLLAVNLWRAGVETRIAVDEASAVELCASFDPHLVMLDVGAAHLSAAQARRHIRAPWDVPMLLVTPNASALNAARAGMNAPGAPIEEAVAAGSNVHVITERILALLRRCSRTA